MVRIGLLLLLLVTGTASADSRWVPLYETSKVLDGKTIRLQIYTTPRTTLYQKQRIGVLVRISSPDRYFSIRTDPLVNRALEIHPYRKGKLRDRRGRYVQTLGWNIHVLSAGEVSIALPPAFYNIGGRERLTFAIPPLQLKIKPLPEYLPPVVAIGQFTVASSLQPEGWQLNNQLVYLKIIISSNEIAARWLPTVGRFLKSNESVNYQHHETRYRDKAGTQSVQSSKTLLIPLKLLRSGKTALPELDLRWFDPATGKINRLVYKVPPVYSIAWYWLLLLSLATALLLLKVAVVVVRRVGAYLGYRSALKDAYMAIDAATDERGLLNGLRLHAEAENWMSNISPEGWYQEWAASYGESQTIKTDIELLSAILYGQQPASDLKIIKDKLVKEIRKYRRSIFRYQ